MMRLSIFQVLLAIIVIGCNLSQEQELQRDKLCWDRELFGDINYPISLDMCRRSRRNIGSRKNRARVIDKLRSGECVHIVVVGGSITCGVSLNKRELVGKDNAWPANLHKWMDKHLPCLNGTHTITNLCVSGAASNRWVDMLRAPNQQQKSLFDQADLFLLDTAVNDVYEFAR